jgi:hypothetical protein
MRITPNEPDPLVTEYLSARTARDQAEERFRDLETRLIKQMEADQRKNYHWAVDGQPHTLTYVQGSTTYVDEVGLRKAMGARNFDQYTRKVLDRRAMEKAMTAGEVDPVTVSRFVTQRPKKPYLTHNIKPRESE